MPTVTQQSLNQLADKHRPKPAAPPPIDPMFSPPEAPSFMDLPSPPSSDLSWLTPNIETPKTTPVTKDAEEGIDSILKRIGTSQSVLDERDARRERVKPVEWEQARNSGFVGVPKSAKRAAEVKTAPLETTIKNMFKEGRWGGRMAGGAALGVGAAALGTLAYSAGSIFNPGDSEVKNPLTNMLKGGVAGAALGLGAEAIRQTRALHAGNTKVTGKAAEIAMSVSKAIGTKGAGSMNMTKRSNVF
jgi:hypothetical protein